MDVSNLTPKDILGLLKNNPGFLIQSIWDNNSPGLQFVLQQYGRPLMNNPNDIFKLATQEIATGQANGEQWAYMLAKVPTSYKSNNYTTTPQFLEAFKLFDEYVGVKEQYNG